MDKSHILKAFRFCSSLDNGILSINFERLLRLTNIDFQYFFHPEYDPLDDTAYLDSVYDTYNSDFLPGLSKDKKGRLVTKLSYKQIINEFQKEVDQIIDD